MKIDAPIWVFRWFDSGWSGSSLSASSPIILIMVYDELQLHLSFKNMIDLLVNSLLKYKTMSTFLYN